MCNGRWLMRDRQLLTLDEGGLRAAARDAARRVDAFLSSREVSVLQKLVAVGGAVEQESFEVQVKARVAGRSAGAGRARRVTRSRSCGRATTTSTTPTGRSTIRARAGCATAKTRFLDQGGRSHRRAARLTLTGRTREEAFGAVLLSRSRYFAPATHSARFYREYFRPAAERVVEKDRRRWLVVYRGVEFYVHLDRLINPPADGYFIEVKSRTWSRRDARDKAAVITELLALLRRQPRRHDQRRLRRFDCVAFLTDAATIFFNVGTCTSDRRLMYKQPLPQAWVPRSLSNSSWPAKPLTYNVMFALRGEKPMTIQSISRPSGYR